MAIAYWNIVFKGRFKFLDLWVQFLTVNINDDFTIIVMFFSNHIANFLSWHCITRFKIDYNNSIPGFSDRSKFHCLN